MPSGSPFQVHQIQATIRFIQGYRYLDRCGETLIKLENALAQGWLPSETSPKAGVLKNDQLGMSANFNSEGMATAQSEFISFEHFLDQTCKIFEILRQVFEIKRIHGASLRVVLQKGFREDELEKAAQYLMNLRLCSPHPELSRLMGGETANALEFVIVTAEDREWNQEPVHQRRRMQSQVIRQERQPPFDERLLRRSRQLASQQRAAIEALLKLRRQHPEVSPVAAQFELEHTFETEFNAEAFDLPTFLQQGWEWADSVRSGIARLQGGMH